MTCIFIDDGAPEAEEFDSNYVCYDDNDPASMRQAAEIVELWPVPKDPRAALALQRVRDAITRRAGGTEG